MAGTVRITCQSHRNDIKHTLKRRLGEVHEIRQSSHGGELETSERDRREKGVEEEKKKRREEEDKRDTRGK